MEIVIITITSRNKPLISRVNFFLIHNRFLLLLLTTFIMLIYSSIIAQVLSPSTQRQ